MSTERRYTWIPDPWAEGYVPSRTINVPIAWLPGRSDGSKRDVFTVGAFGPLLCVMSRSWRDDLRKGWHVVPKGVRYVVLRSRIDGQRGLSASLYTACRLAEKLNAGTENPDAYMWSSSGTLSLSEAIASDIGVVLDLHDLADHRDAKPANVTMGDSFAAQSPRETARQIRAAMDKVQPAPRFVVRSAAEMREGEPSRRYTQRDIEGDIVARDLIWLAAHENNWAMLNALGAPWGAPSAHSYVSAMVDTSSPEWQAFDAKHRKPSGGCWDCWDCGRATLRESGTCDDCAAAHAVLPEIVKPPGPSDAEIVKQYERTMQDGGANGKLHGIGWVTNSIPMPRSRKEGNWFLQVPHAGNIVEVPQAKVLEVWSRELARLAAESADRERRRVSCQGDWPGEGEFDA